MNINNYTTVDRIFAKLSRELPNEILNEGDTIEWLGEAMDYLKMPELQEEAVAFVKVENFEAIVPDHLHLVTQVARFNGDSLYEEKTCTEESTIEEEIPELTCEDLTDEKVNCMFNALGGSFRPYFDMQWQYIPWASSYSRKNHFSPVRLANHSLFNTIVCKEKSSPYEESCEDEYTIIGTFEKKFRFSFKEGYVAVAFIRSALDKDTGYPLVPDNTRHINAISYYIRWKIAETKCWNGRENFCNIAQDEERKWNKYIGQATSYSKMPKTLDQYQNLLEETHSMIPRHKRYYNYFGNLGRRINIKMT